jgi:hypothetical protein
VLFDVAVVLQEIEPRAQHKIGEQQSLAAVRHFDPAYVRLGSNREVPPSGLMSALASCGHAGLRPFAALNARTAAAMWRGHRQLSGGVPVAAPARCVPSGGSGC